MLGYGMLPTDAQLT